jgi:hypothetical protein
MEFTFETIYFRRFLLILRSTIFFIFFSQEVEVQLLRNTVLIVLLNNV